jgi:hypothetical protein
VASRLRVEPSASELAVPGSEVLLQAMRSIEGETDEPHDASMVKIAFRDAEGDVETLWAVDLGDGRYRLDSSPWFQYGVSWMDVVAAEPEPDGVLFFTRIVEKGGHRTLRVASDSPVQKSLLDSIVALGCTYEGANPKYIAIDVPPAALLQDAVAVLMNSGLNWEYADPPYETLHGSGV